jgi:hypothetical protein
MLMSIAWVGSTNLHCFLDVTGVSAVPKCLAIVAREKAQITLGSVAATGRISLLPVGTGTSTYGSQGS